MRRPGRRCMQRVLLLASLAGCGGGEEGAAVPDAGGPARVMRPAGWGNDSHGKDAPPSYDRVFQQGTPARLELTIAAADWEAMRADLATMLGKYGSGGLSLPEPGTVNFIPRTPLYVPTDVRFNGKIWRHVGIRFRGNATLAMTWRAGQGKLPFRLDFDELEDRFPEIDDQRFYGIKAVALINNMGDESMLREKVAADLYRLAGVPAPRTSFVRLFIDHGQGPTYFGLYTLAEIPGAALLKTHFGESGGNLYKPEGNGAKFGTFDQASFEKKTNERSSDFSDVQAVFGALHGSRRDPAAWRAALEKVFDVPGFLRWLAANEAIENWDTYGVIAHNYYLYGVTSEGGRLHWIPWDNTNAFDQGFLLWKTPPVTLWSVGADWPLIRFLADDPVYRAAYLANLRTFAMGPFAPAALSARLRAEHASIAPYVTGPEGEQPSHTLLAKPDDFQAELQKILQTTAARHAEVMRAVGAGL